MALDTVTSSNLYTSDITYQYATRVVADPEERTSMISLINFLQKHRLDETQATLLRELSLTENSEVTLDELQQAISTRDNKLINDAKTHSHGHISPLPMETEENYRKLQIALPPSLLLHTNEKPSAVYNDVSIAPSLQNGLPSSPRYATDDSPIIIPKVESTSPQNDSIPILVQPPTSSSSVTSPSSHHVPFILNNLPASNHPNNILTLLRPTQNIVTSNPNQQQTQILLDVGSNSLTQLQQLGGKSLNGVIPIQLNLSAQQAYQLREQQQQQQQQQQIPQQQQQQQQQPRTQVVYNTQQLQLLNTNGSKQPQPIFLASLTNDNFSKVTTSSNNLQSSPSLAFQVQQPISTQSKLGSPATNPLQFQSRNEDAQIRKEGDHITLDTNRRPILSYSQVPSSMQQSPKTILTSNGICQVENVQIPGNAWVKDSQSDLHAIPIINTTLSPHFSFDPAFELGQRRRKKRAVFTPHVRRALELSFEQNTRPSRRELEYLAGKLGLLFEEVRVWFCNKRQKERQQIHQIANDQPQDVCGDAYNSFGDGSPPLVETQHSVDDSINEQEYHVKEEFDSDVSLHQCVSDSNDVMSESSESQLIHPAIDSNFSILQNSMA